MRLLVDTHMALWMIGDPSRIAPHAADLFADPANTVVVSVVTLWEIAIKHPLKRGRPDDIRISSEAAKNYFEEAGYELVRS